MNTVEELNNLVAANVPPNADYEVYSGLKRQISWLRIGTGMLLLAVVGLSASSYRLASRKPIILVTRINDVGQAQAIKYTSTEFTPDDGVVRSALNEWAKLRYTLTRETAGRDYAHNYYFLSAPQSSASMEKDRTSQRIVKLLAGQGTPNDLEILSVQIQSMGTEKKPDGTLAEGTALIDMQKVFPASTGVEAHKEHWTVNVQFSVNPEQANERYATDPTFQLINPLGVTITYFHEDRAA